MVCALLLAGCNDHRYGFFGDSEGIAVTDGETTGGPTTTMSPTTVSPTTLPPTTMSPTTLTTETSLTTLPPTSVTSMTSGGTACGELALAPEVPVQAFAPLASQPDSFTLSCGSFGGSDVAFVWRAPFTGRFVADTAGSSVDTILGVISGECNGPELGCNDDGTPDLGGRVEVDLFGGQIVTFVVDSFASGVGEVVLTIDEVPIDDTCPDGDFGIELPLTIPGQTAGAANVRGSSCGGLDGPEIEALWTAPFSALYHFEVTDSDFDPVMYLLDGSCGGPELICSDDANGLNPAFNLFVGASQSVVIVVDGAGGSAGKFTLSVTQL